MKSLSIIFVLILGASCSRFIIEPKAYLIKLHDKVSAKLAANPQSLVIQDFEGDFDEILMGKSLKGKVTFHSGFVSRIGKFELNDQKFVESWNDTLVGFI